MDCKTDKINDNNNNNDPQNTVKNNDPQDKIENNNPKKHAKNNVPQDKTENNEPQNIIDCSLSYRLPKKYRDISYDHFKKK